jgi:hypothetical protein
MRLEGKVPGLNILQRKQNWKLVAAKRRKRRIKDLSTLFVPSVHFRGWKISGILHGSPF